MELSRVKILVDKYFDGLTSLEEEQELKRYFAENEDIPEEYQAVKMMLGAFDTLSHETPNREVKVNVETKRRNIFRLNVRRMAGMAAAVAILIGAAITLVPNSNNMDTPAETTPEYICYVNGVKVEDDQLAYAEASRILGNLSEDMQLAMAEVNRLTHYNIVK
jgi:anti-sigma-K factor RskA